MKTATLALALAATLIAGASIAAPINYTFEGTATGTVNGVAFTNQAFSYVLLADTTTATNFNLTNTFSSGVITIAGTACAAGCTITTPADYRFSTSIQNGNVMGIEPAAGAPPAINEGFFAAPPTLDAPVAPMTATVTNGYAPYASIATSGGPIIITTNTSLPTFSAALAPVPTAVPTLSEWAMILLGTMLAGAGALYIQRRRLIA